MPRDELIWVDLRRVLYFQSDRNYTDVHFVNGVHVTLPTGRLYGQEYRGDGTGHREVSKPVRLSQSPVPLFHGQSAL